MCGMRLVWSKGERNMYRKSPLTSCINCHSLAAVMNGMPQDYMVANTLQLITLLLSINRPLEAVMCYITVVSIYVYTIQCFDFWYMHCYRELVHLHKWSNSIPFQLLMSVIWCKEENWFTLRFDLDVEHFSFACYHCVVII